MTSTHTNAAPSVSLESDVGALFPMPSTSSDAYTLSFEPEEVMGEGDPLLDFPPGGGDLGSDVLGFPPAPVDGLHAAPQESTAPAFLAKPKRKRGPLASEARKKPASTRNAHGVLDLQPAHRPVLRLPSRAPAFSAQTALAVALMTHATRNRSMLAADARLMHDASKALTTTAAAAPTTTTSAAAAAGAPLVTQPTPPVGPGTRGRARASSSITPMEPVTEPQAALARVIMATPDGGAILDEVARESPLASPRTLSAQLRAANSPSSSESGMALSSSGAGPRSPLNEGDVLLAGGDGGQLQLDSPPATATGTGTNALDPKLIFRFVDGREQLFSTEELRSRSNKFFVAFGQRYNPTQEDIVNMKRFRRRHQLRISSRKGRQEQRQRQSMLENRLSERFESIMGAISGVMSQFVHDNSLRSMLTSRLRSALTPKLLPEREFEEDLEMDMDA
jgi:hypothetical protein